MAEAELRITPRVTGNVRSSLGRDVSALSKLDKSQRKALRSGQREASRLEKAYHSIGRAVGGASKTIGKITSHIFSLKTAVTGLVVGGAGKSILEATIGRAAQVKKAERVLGIVLKDQNKVNQAIERARDLTKEVASLDFASALQGIEKTAILADGDVNRAGELVKLAKALEASKPGQSFDEALFSLKELETGDVMSLRERFGIRLPGKKEAEKAAKAGKKSVKQYYLDELNSFIENQYAGGVDELLRIDREFNSLEILKTQIADVFTTVGLEAEEVARKELPSLIEELNKLKADPQFKQDIRDMARGFADLTKDAIQLAKDVPKVVKSISSFVRENPNLVKIGGGLIAADVATGGGVRALGGAAARGTFAAGGKLLSKVGGKKGAAAGAALGGLADVGAIPVRVVNFGEFGGSGGGGDLLDDAVDLVDGKGKGLKNKALGLVDDIVGTSIAQKAVASVASKIGFLKGGSAAAGLAPVASAALAGAGILGGGAVAGLGAYQSFTGTAKNLKIADKLGPKENLRNAVPSFTGRGDRFGNMGAYIGPGVTRAASTARARPMAASFRSSLDAAMITRDPAARRRELQSAISGATSALESAPRGEVGGMIDQMNADLKALGLKVNNKDGDVRLVVDAESARAALGEGVLREANYNLTLHYNGNGGPGDAENMAKQMEAGLRELARQDAKTGAG